MDKIVLILIIIALLTVIVICFYRKNSAKSEHPDKSEFCGRGTGYKNPGDLSRGIIYEPDMAKKPLPPFKEITVVDNDDITIKITAADPYHMWGYSLHVYLENKSGGDTFYSFALSSAKVNGIQLKTDEVATDVNFYIELGKNYSYASGEIAFIAEDLKKKGINKYGDIKNIELGFIVYETLNKDKVIFTGTVTVKLQRGN